MENNETIPERKKRVPSQRREAIEKRRLATRATKARQRAKEKERQKNKRKPYQYSGKFLPYERAKRVVKVLELKSRAEYIQWHEKYHPDYLPKRPDNAYKKEFEGWIKFLNKPEDGSPTKRMIEEKLLAERLKQKAKETEKETKRVKRNIGALVKYEMNQAQTLADRLKRREKLALNKHKKQKKKIERRLEKPVIIPVHVTKPKKPKKSKYLEYHEAKRFIVHEKFESIDEYKSWWDINTPAGIPKRPDRVYSDFKWSDFLGRKYDNRFQKKDYRSIYRTYEDATRYVRTLGIKNAKQWDDYCKAGKNPKDIPRYPQLVYRYRPDDPTWGKWFSWDDWLGKNANQMLQAFKEQQKVLIVIVPNGAPQGIFSFIYKNGDENEIDRFIDDNELYVIRIYKIEAFDWVGYLSRRHNPYNGQLNTYVISNINEVLYDLDTYMERVL